MKTKLNQLLNFPCFFTYKVIGESCLTLFNKIIKFIKFYIFCIYFFFIKFFINSKYYSFSITIIVYNFNKLKKIYTEFSKINLIKIVL